MKVVLMDVSDLQKHRQNLANQISQIDRQIEELSSPPSKLSVEEFLVRSYIRLESTKKAAEEMNANSYRLPGQKGSPRMYKAEDISAVLKGPMNDTPPYLAELARHIFDMKSRRANLAWD